MSYWTTQISGARWCLSACHFLVERSFKIYLGLQSDCTFAVVCGTSSTVQQVAVEERNSSHSNPSPCRPVKQKECGLSNVPALLWHKNGISKVVLSKWALRLREYQKKGAKNNFVYICDYSVFWSSRFLFLLFLWFLEIPLVLYLFALISLTWLWGGLHMAYRHFWMLVLFVIFNSLQVSLNNLVTDGTRVC